MERKERLIRRSLKIGLVATLGFAAVCAATAGILEYSKKDNETIRLPPSEVYFSPFVNPAQGYR